jgi:hypothetical protein
MRNTEGTKTDFRNSAFRTPHSAFAPPPDALRPPGYNAFVPPFLYKSTLR